MLTPGEANAAFYQAFEALDLEAMAVVWKQADDVTCAHPGEAPARGWEAISASWRRIFESTDLFRIRTANVQVREVGGLAVVVCVELITAVANGEAMEGAVAATNVFERVDGHWLLVHHQGSGLAVRSTTAGTPTSSAVN
jgi:ketosteroid isomerase-like protein